MAYLVIAYPIIPDHAFSSIQAHRKIHDARKYAVVNPHFTIVFPVDGITESQFCNEIASCIAGIRPFGFSLCKAIVHEDLLSSQYLSFLVPGEGYNNFLHLHDRLYSAMLAKELRADLPYIPHITIGCSHGAELCNQMTTTWNASAKAINGAIHQLTIIRLQNDIVSPVQTIILQ